MARTKQKKVFIFESPTQEIQETVLFPSHSRRVKASRLAPFAGYRMPLWFSSIRDEHKAVRETAGLFDCTHMGVFNIQGAQAEEFLNITTTNDVSLLKAGQAQYSYVLDTEGSVLDDIIVYCRAPYDYLMVVNAGNKVKVKSWLTGLLEGQWIMDQEDPDRTINLSPKFRDLGDQPDNQALVDIAIQGPASSPILQELAGKDPTELKSFHFCEIEINNILCILARTGYTGAKLGFELFVTHDQAENLWEYLLDKGQAHGLIPCGLGARDSLRIEAGLPLYGHELGGSPALTPFEAGYPWAVKLGKEYFIGQKAMQTRSETYSFQVARLALPGERGVRPVRMDDPVLDESGTCIGWILSSANAGDQQIALANLKREHTESDQHIGAYYLARNDNQVQQGRKQEVALDEQLMADLLGKIVPRFARF